jgi:hypothetical protein
MSLTIEHTTTFNPKVAPCLCGGSVEHSAGRTPYAMDEGAAYICIRCTSCGISINRSINIYHGGTEKLKNEYSCAVEQWNRIMTNTNITDT